MRFGFDPKTDYILEDDRVRLQPVTEQDARHYISLIADEPELWKFSLASIHGLADMEAYFRATIVQREAGKEYAFTVYDKARNEYAGSTRFYEIQPRHKNLNLGYTWYGKKFQGSGLNKHCKFLMLQFAFETLGAERVEFRADVRNVRSINAIKSIGGTPEGFLRSHLPLEDGSRRDSVILRILKPEWENRIKAGLLRAMHNSETAKLPD